MIILRPTYSLLLYIICYNYVRAQCISSRYDGWLGPVFQTSTDQSQWPSTIFPTSDQLPQPAGLGPVLRTKVPCESAPKIYLVGCGHDVYEIIEDIKNEGLKTGVQIHFYLFQNGRFKFLSNFITTYAILKSVLRRHNIYYCTSREHDNQYNDSDACVYDSTVIMIPESSESKALVDTGAWNLVEDKIHENPAFKNDGVVNIWNLVKKDIKQNEKVCAPVNVNFKNSPTYNPATLDTKMARDYFRRINLNTAYQTVTTGADENYTYNTYNIDNSNYPYFYTAKQTNYVCQPYYETFKPVVSKYVSLPNLYTSYSTADKQTPNPQIPNVSYATTSHEGYSIKTQQQPSNNIYVPCTNVNTAQNPTASISNYAINSNPQNTNQYIVSKPTTYSDNSKFITTYPVASSNVLSNLEYTPYDTTKPSYQYALQSPANVMSQYDYSTPTKSAYLNQYISKITSINISPYSEVKYSPELYKPEVNPYDKINVAAVENITPLTATTKVPTNYEDITYGKQITVPHSPICNSMSLGNSYSSLGKQYVTYYNDQFSQSPSIISNSPQPLVNELRYDSYHPKLPCYINKWPSYSYYNDFKKPQFETQLEPSISRYQSDIILKPYEDLNNYNFVSPTLSATQEILPGKGNVLLHDKKPSTVQFTKYNDLKTPKTSSLVVPFIPTAAMTLPCQILQAKYFKQPCINLQEYNPQVSKRYLSEFPKKSYVLPFGTQYSEISNDKMLPLPSSTAAAFTPSSIDTRPKNYVLYQNSSPICSNLAQSTNSAQIVSPTTLPESYSWAQTEIIKPNEFKTQPTKYTEHSYPQKYNKVSFWTSQTTPTAQSYVQSGMEPSLPLYSPLSPTCISKNPQEYLSQVTSNICSSVAPHCSLVTQDASSNNNGLAYAELLKPTQPITYTEQSYRYNYDKSPLEVTERVPCLYEYTSKPTIQPSKTTPPIYLPLRPTAVYTNPKAYFAQAPSYICSNFVQPSSYAQVSSSSPLALKPTKYITQPLICATKSYPSAYYKAPLSATQTTPYSRVSIPESYVQPSIAELPPYSPLSPTSIYTNPKQYFSQLPSNVCEGVAKPSYLVTQPCIYSLSQKGVVNPTDSTWNSNKYTELGATSSTPYIDASTSYSLPAKTVSSYYLSSLPTSIYTKPKEYISQQPPSICGGEIKPSQFVTQAVTSSTSQLPSHHAPLKVTPKPNIPTSVPELPLYSPLHTTSLYTKPKENSAQTLIYISNSVAQPYNFVSQTASPLTISKPYEYKTETFKDEARPYPQRYNVAPLEQYSYASTPQSYIASSIPALPHYSPLLPTNFYTNPKEYISQLSPYIRGNLAQPTSFPQAAQTEFLKPDGYITRPIQYADITYSNSPYLTPSSTIPVTSDISYKSTPQSHLLPYKTVLPQYSLLPPTSIYTKPKEYLSQPPSYITSSVVQPCGFIPHDAAPVVVSQPNYNFDNTVNIKPSENTAPPTYRAKSIPQKNHETPLDNQTAPSSYVSTIQSSKEIPQQFSPLHVTSAYTKPKEYLSQAPSYISGSVAQPCSFVTQAVSPIPVSTKPITYSWAQTEIPDPTEYTTKPEQSYSQKYFEAPIKVAQATPFSYASLTPQSYLQPDLLQYTPLHPTSLFTQPKEYISQYPSYICSDVEKPKNYYAKLEDVVKPIDNSISQPISPIILPKPYQYGFTPLKNMIPYEYISQPEKYVGYTGSILPQTQIETPYENVQPILVLENVKFSVSPKTYSFTSVPNSLKPTYYSPLPTSYTQEYSPSIPTSVYTRPKEYYSQLPSYVCKDVTTTPDNLFTQTPGMFLQPCTQGFLSTENIRQKDYTTQSFPKKDYSVPLDITTNAPCSEITHSQVAPTSYSSPIITSPAFSSQFYSLLRPTCVYTRPKEYLSYPSKYICVNDPKTTAKVFTLPNSPIQWADSNYKLTPNVQFLMSTPCSKYVPQTSFVSVTSTNATPSPYSNVNPSYQEPLKYLSKSNKPSLSQNVIAQATSVEPIVSQYLPQIPWNPYPTSVPVSTAYPCEKYKTSSNLPAPQQYISAAPNIALPQIDKPCSKYLTPYHETSQTPNTVTAQLPRYQMPSKEKYPPSVNLEADLVQPSIEYSQVFSSASSIKYSAPLYTQDPQIPKICWPIQPALNQHKPVYVTAAGPHGVITSQTLLPLSLYEYLPCQTLKLYTSSLPCLSIDKTQKPCQYWAQPFGYMPEYSQLSKPILPPIAVTQLYTPSTPVCSTSYPKIVYSSKPCQAQSTFTTKNTSPISSVSLNEHPDYIQPIVSYSNEIYTKPVKYLPKQQPSSVEYVTQMPQTVSETVTSYPIVSTPVYPIVPCISQTPYQEPTQIQSRPLKYVKSTLTDKYAPKIFTTESAMPFTPIQSEWSSSSGVSTIPCGIYSTPQEYSLLPQTYTINYLPKDPKSKILETTAKTFSPTHFYENPTSPLLYPCDKTTIPVTTLRYGPINWLTATPQPCVNYPSTSSSWLTKSLTRSHPASLPVLSTRPSNIYNYPTIPQTPALPPITYTPVQILPTSFVFSSGLPLYLCASPAEYLPQTYIPKTRTYIYSTSNHKHSPYSYVPTVDTIPSQLYTICSGPCLPVTPKNSDVTYLSPNYDNVLPLATKTILYPYISEYSNKYTSKAIESVDYYNKPSARPQICSYVPYASPIYNIPTPPINTPLSLSGAAPLTTSAHYVPPIIKPISSVYTTTPTYQRPTTYVCQTSPKTFEILSRPTLEPCSIAPIPTASKPYESTTKSLYDSTRLSKHNNIVESAPCLTNYVEYPKPVLPLVTPTSYKQISSPVTYTSFRNIPAFSLRKQPCTSLPKPLDNYTPTSLSYIQPLSPKVETTYQQPCTTYQWQQPCTYEKPTYYAQEILPTLYTPTIAAPTFNTPIKNLMSTSTSAYRPTIPCHYDRKYIDDYEKSNLPYEKINPYYTQSDINSQSPIYNSYTSLPTKKPSYQNNIHLSPSLTLPCLYGDNIPISSKWSISKPCYKDIYSYKQSPSAGLIQPTEYYPQLGQFSANIKPLYSPTTNVVQELLPTNTAPTLDSRILPQSAPLYRQVDATPYLTNPYQILKNNVVPCDIRNTYQAAKYISQPWTGSLTHSQPASVTYTKPIENVNNNIVNAFPCLAPCYNNERIQLPKTNAHAFTEYIQPCSPAQYTATVNTNAPYYAQSSKYKFPAAKTVTVSDVQPVYSNTFKQPVCQIYSIDNQIPTELSSRNGPSRISSYSITPKYDPLKISNDAKFDLPTSKAYIPTGTVTPASYGVPCSPTLNYKPFLPLVTTPSNQYYTDPLIYPSIVQLGPVQYSTGSQLEPCSMKPKYETSYSPISTPSTQYYAALLHDPLISRDKYYEIPSYSHMKSDTLKYKKPTQLSPVQYPTFSNVPCSPKLIYETCSSHLSTPNTQYNTAPLQNPWIPKAKYYEISSYSQLKSDTLKYETPTQFGPVQYTATAYNIPCLPKPKYDTSSSLIITPNTQYYTAPLHDSPIPEANYYKIPSDSQIPSDTFKYEKPSQFGPVQYPATSYNVPCLLKPKYETSSNDIRTPNTKYYTVPLDDSSIPRGKYFEIPSYSQITSDTLKYEKPSQLSPVHYPAPLQDQLAPEYYEIPSSLHIKSDTLKFEQPTQYGSIQYPQGSYVQPCSPKSKYKTSHNPLNTPTTQFYTTPILPKIKHYNKPLYTQMKTDYLKYENPSQFGPVLQPAHSYVEPCSFIPKYETSYSPLNTRTTQYYTPSVLSPNIKHYEIPSYPQIKLDTLKYDSPTDYGTDSYQPKPELSLPCKTTEPLPQIIPFSISPRPNIISLSPLSQTTSSYAKGYPSITPWYALPSHQTRTQSQTISKIPCQEMKSLKPENYQLLDSTYSQYTSGRKDFEEINKYGFHNLKPASSVTPINYLNLPIIPVAKLSQSTKSFEALPTAADEDRPYFQEPLQGSYFSNETPCRKANVYQNTPSVVPETGYSQGPVQLFKTQPFSSPFSPILTNECTKWWPCYRTLENYVEGPVYNILKSTQPCLARFVPSLPVTQNPSSADPDSLYVQTVSDAYTPKVAQPETVSISPKQVPTFNVLETSSKFNVPCHKPAYTRNLGTYALTRNNEPFQIANPCNRYDNYDEFKQNQELPVSLSSPLPSIIQKAPTDTLSSSISFTNLTPPQESILQDVLAPSSSKVPTYQSVDNYETLKPITISSGITPTLSLYETMPSSPWKSKSTYHTEIASQVPLKLKPCQMPPPSNPIEEYLQPLQALDNKYQQQQPIEKAKPCWPFYFVKSEQLSPSGTTPQSTLGYTTELPLTKPTTQPHNKVINALPITASSSLKPCQQQGLIAPGYQYSDNKYKVFINEDILKPTYSTSGISPETVCSHEPYYTPSKTYTMSSYQKMQKPINIIPCTLAKSHNYAYNQPWYQAYKANLKPVHNTEIPTTTPISTIPSSIYKQQIKPERINVAPILPQFTEYINEPRLFNRQPGEFTLAPAKTQPPLYESLVSWPYSKQWLATPIEQKPLKDSLQPYICPEPGIIKTQPTPLYNDALTIPRTLPCDITSPCLNTYKPTTTHITANQMETFSWTLPANLELSQILNLYQTYSTLPVGTKHVDATTINANKYDIIQNEGTPCIGKYEEYIPSKIDLPQSKPYSELKTCPTSAYKNIKPQLSSSYDYLTKPCYETEFASVQPTSSSEISHSLPTYINSISSKPESYVPESKISMAPCVSHQQDTIASPNQIQYGTFKALPTTKDIISKEPYFTKYAAIKPLTYAPTSVTPQLLTTSSDNLVKQNPESGSTQSPCIAPQPVVHQFEILSNEPCKKALPYQYYSVQPTAFLPTSKPIETSYTTNQESPVLDAQYLENNRYEILANQPCQKPLYTEYDTVNPLVYSIKSIIVKPCSNVQIPQSHICEQKENIPLEKTKRPWFSNYNPIVSPTYQTSPEYQEAVSTVNIPNSLDGSTFETSPQYASTSLPNASVQIQKPIVSVAPWYKPFISWPCKSVPLSEHKTPLIYAPYEYLYSATPVPVTNKVSYIETTPDINSNNLVTSSNLPCETLELNPIANIGTSKSTPAQYYPGGSNFWWNNYYYGRNYDYLSSQNDLASRNPSIVTTRPCNNLQGDNQYKIPFAYNNNYMTADTDTRLISNWLRPYVRQLATNIQHTHIENLKDKVPNNQQVSIDLGNAAIAQCVPDSCESVTEIKTSDPNINVKTWKSKVKLLKARLVIDTEERWVTNFVPVVKARYTSDKVANVTKNDITTKFGDTIVVNGYVGMYKPIVFLCNDDYLKLMSGCSNILWMNYDTARYWEIYNWCCNPNMYKPKFLCVETVESKMADNNGIGQNT